MSHSITENYQDVIYINCCIQADLKNHFKSIHYIMLYIDSLILICPPEDPFYTRFRKAKPVLYLVNWIIMDAHVDKHIDPRLNDQSNAKETHLPIV